MLCSWIGRINTVKMSILHKAIIKFNTFPIKLPTVFFMELEQKISQLVRKHKRERRMELEESTCLTSEYTRKLQSDSMVQAQRQKYRSMEQKRKPINESMHLWILIFHKRGRNIQWRKDNLFNKW